MGITADEWYAIAENMTAAQHVQMQKTGDPIIRTALREIANLEGRKFGSVKQRFLDGEVKTVFLVLGQVEDAHPGRFDAFAYCDGCRKFMLHKYDGPAVELDPRGHWPTFLDSLGFAVRGAMEQPVDLGPR